MTTREFYVNVLDLIDVIVSDDPTGCVDTDAMSAKARELIAALDARNEKRKSLDSKEKREVAQRVLLVQNFFKGNDEKLFTGVTRDEIAEATAMTPAQAQAACKTLVTMGRIHKGEAKIGKSKRTVYYLPEE